MKSEEKDLGITAADKLSPEVHVRKKTGETYILVENIRAAFNYLDEEMKRNLIVTMIRPRLNYAAKIWSPRTKRNIKK